MFFKKTLVFLTLGLASTVIASPIDDDKEIETAGYKVVGGKYK